MASVTASRKPLSSGPWTLRSSGLMRAQRFQQFADRAFFAQRRHAHGFQRGFVAGGGDLRQNLGLQRSDVGHDKPQNGSSGRLA